MKLIQAIMLNGWNQEYPYYSLNRDVEEWQRLLELAGQDVILKQEVGPGLFYWTKPNEEIECINVPAPGTLIIHHPTNPHLWYSSEAAYFVLVIEMSLEQYALNFAPIDRVSEPGKEEVTHENN